MAPRTLSLPLSLSFSHYFSLFLLSMSHIPQANEIFHGILHYKAPVTSPGNFTKMSRPTVWFPGATRPFAYLDPTTNTVLMFYEQYSIFPFRSKVRFVELSEWAIVNMFRLRRGSVSHTPSPSSLPLRSPFSTCLPAPPPLPQRSSGSNLSPARGPGTRGSGRGPSRRSRCPQSWTGRATGRLGWATHPCTTTPNQASIVVKFYAKLIHVLAYTRVYFIKRQLVI